MTDQEKIKIAKAFVNCHNRDAIMDWIGDAKFLAIYNRLNEGFFGKVGGLSLSRSVDISANDSDTSQKRKFLWTIED